MYAYQNLEIWPARPVQCIKYDPVVTLYYIDLCSLSGVGKLSASIHPSVQMHQNSVHRNLNHDWWSLFVEEAKDWKLYDSNNSFLDRIANIFVFCGLTLSRFVTTNRNIDNYVMSQNHRKWLSSSQFEKLPREQLCWTRDAVIILRVISSRGCSGAFLSLHNTIILTTCSDRARRRAQNISLSLDPTVPCFASVLLYPSLTIYFIILVKRKWI